MGVRTVIVGHRRLPEDAVAVILAAFPEEPEDRIRAFWPDGSVHALVYNGDTLVGHAGFVTRTLYLPRRAFHTAYVEYVAVEPKRRRYGTAAIRALQTEIERRGFLLAALATGSPGFYERLGWQMWRGPTAYRAENGAVVPTPDEKPMVLDLGANVNLDDPIECDWRPKGDIW